MATPSEPRYLAVEADAVPASLRAAATAALAVVRRELRVSPVLVWLRPAISDIDRLDAGVAELSWKLARAADEHDAERRAFTDAGSLAGVTMALYPGLKRIYIVADGEARAGEIFHRTLHEAAHVAGPASTEDEVEAFARRHCPGCAHCNGGQGG